MRRLTIGMLLLIVAGCGQAAAPQTPQTGAAPPRTGVVSQAPTVSEPTAPPASLTVSPTASPPPMTEPPSIVPPTTVPPPPGGLAQVRLAPPITDEIWINSEPLALSELGKAGKITLVEFWTYGCYNCRNVLPHLQAWHETYADQGLTIIGVHYPEFDRERNVDNVKRALVDLDVTYPVSIDNDGSTWRAYGQRYWPTMYLVDKTGHIRYLHIGEGAYETTEQWIQYLLAEQL